MFTKLYLRANYCNQSWHSVGNPVNAEFVFLAVEILWNVALFKIFSWNHMFCLARLIKIFATFCRPIFEQNLQRQLLPDFLVTTIVESKISILKSTFKKSGTNAEFVSCIVKMESAFQKKNLISLFSNSKSEVEKCLSRSFPWRT